MASEIDEAAGHRFFSAAAFNKTWEYLDMPERGVAETEMMLHAAHASLYHWLAQPEVSPRERSVGYWLLGRVYAVAGQGERALHYSGLSLEEAEAGRLEPFYLGYALEAVARAYSVLARSEESASFKARALAEAARIEDGESKNVLEADLSGL